MKSPLFRFCNAGFKTTLRLFGDQVVEGRENVPPTGPAIFISNHLGNLDPPIMAALTNRSPGFLAKKELFKFPLFAFLLKSYGAHPLNRGTHDIGALRWATRKLREPDAALILFPEGTRNKKADGMRKALPGVTQIAAMTGVPIVPVGITGSEKLQGMWKVFVPRARIRIKIGRPIIIKSDNAKRPTRDTLETMTTEIMVRVARLLPESHRGYYRDLMDTPFNFTEEIDAAVSGAVAETAT